MKSSILLLFVILTSCSKSNPNPNEELPPATQTGAGIFACHVNGQSFIDKSGDVAFNQLIDGQYYFGVSGEVKNSTPRYINLGTQKKQIIEGQTYQLIELQDGNAFGGAGFRPSPNNYQSVLTSQNQTGELKITKLDYTNYIVSGTFWFDIINPYSGQLIQIRDGRFDTHFTQ